MVSIESSMAFGSLRIIATGMCSDGAINPFALSAAAICVGVRPK
jgi:hypothetical protein